ncbi:hypothetical protein BH23BAC1_BH23BAC1_21970 [soil metagenome]
MIISGKTKRTIRNEESSLTIDLFGGAITDFHLHDDVNPLNFSFLQEQMPANNKGGAPYQGHFLCLGRWGEPSAGESKAGIPNHGQIANIPWEIDDNGINDTIMMQAVSSLEGLRLKRTLRIDGESPVYGVREEVTNINPLGRFYNMVQHPTLAHPFLDNFTIINCNADIGYNYIFSKNPEQQTSNWPNGVCEDSSILNLSRPEKAYNSVFSFIIKKGDKLGWISAFSPKYKLVIGYLWMRKDYPWINLWQDWAADQIRFRGIEFGTTGIHKPFNQIVEDRNTQLFGEKTLKFIDAGEVVSRSYLSFLYKIESVFEGVENIWVDQENIILQEKNTSKAHKINTNLLNFL